MQATRILGRLLHATAFLGLLALFPRAPDLPISPGLLFAAWFLVLRIGIQAMSLEGGEALLLGFESLPFLYLAGRGMGRLPAGELYPFLLMSLSLAAVLQALEDWLRPPSLRLASLLASLALAGAAAPLLALFHAGGFRSQAAFLAAALALFAFALFRKARRGHARRLS
jgi:hypothetical protein